MMSFAYRVDELLALRDSVSESAVSIEKFPDEDVIRGQCRAYPPHPFTFHRSPFLSRNIIPDASCVSLPYSHYTRPTLSHSSIARLVAFLSSCYCYTTSSN